MHPAVTRDRETRPGAWVVEVMDGRGLNAEEVAVLVKKSSSTVWRWRRQGIDYLDWIGLLTLLELPAAWKPGEPVTTRKQ